MLPLHMASLGGFTDCCRKLISYGEFHMPQGPWIVFRCEIDRVVMIKP